MRLPMMKRKRRRPIQQLSQHKRMRHLLKIRMKEMQIIHTNRKAILKIVETIVGKKERKLQSLGKKMKARKPMIGWIGLRRRIHEKKVVTIKVKDRTRG